MNSFKNLVTERLRETADLLRKPQAEVAANWMRVPAITKRPGAGVTSGEFRDGMKVVARLAKHVELGAAYA